MEITYNELLEGFHSEVKEVWVCSLMWRDVKNKILRNIKPTKCIMEAEIRVGARNNYKRLDLSFNPVVPEGRRPKKSIPYKGNSYYAKHSELYIFTTQKDCAIKYSEITAEYLEALEEVKTWVNNQKELQQRIANKELKPFQ